MTRQRHPAHLFRVSIGDMMDATMVTEYIRAVGLDPRPTEQTQPFRLRSRSWTLLVETYDWGRVCVATNQLACVVTWIEHLELPDGLPVWCLALRKRFDSPSCLGHHQVGDPICDGDAKEPACIWRGRCADLRAEALASRATPEAVVAALDTAGDSGLPPPAPQRLSPVPRPAGNAAGAAAPIAREDDKECKKRRYIPQVGPIKDPYTFVISRQWALETMERLAAALQRQWAGIEQHKCGEGGMYYADKIQRSGHFSLYIRQVGAAAIPRCIGWAFPERRTAGVRLQIYAHNEAHVWLRRKLPESIAVKPWKDGNRVYAVVNLRQDQIGVVVRALREMAEEGLWERIDPTRKNRSPIHNIRDGKKRKEEQRVAS